MCNVITLLDINEFSYVSRILVHNGITLPGMMELDEVTTILLLGVMELCCITKLLPDITEFCYITRIPLHYHNSITRCNKLCYNTGIL